MRERERERMKERERERERERRERENNLEKRLLGTGRNIFWETDNFLFL